MYHSGNACVCTPQELNVACARRAGVDRVSRGDGVCTPQKL